MHGCCHVWLTAEFSGVVLSCFTLGYSHGCIPAPPTEPELDLFSPLFSRGKSLFRGMGQQTCGCFLVGRTVVFGEWNVCLLWPADCTCRCIVSKVAGSPAPPAPAPPPPNTDPLPNPNTDTLPTPSLVCPGWLHGCIRFKSLQSQTLMTGRITDFETELLKKKER